MSKLSDLKVNLRMKMRVVGTALAKRNKYLRIMIRFTMNHYRILRYRIHTFGKKVRPHNVIFNAFNGKNYSDTPKAVYEYMLSNPKYKNYNFIWVFAHPENYEFLKENPRTFIVTNKSKRYERALASSKYWICNYRIYDYIFPKKNQQYVQCWHGTPLKRLGYDIGHSNNAMNSEAEIKYKYKSDAERFTYILSPSAFATEKFATAWNLNETNQRDKIIEVGYPRNDYLINFKDEDVVALKKELGIPMDKKVLLYAPTWRDNQHTAGVGYVYETQVDFAKLREQLSDEWVILFRAHYLVANSFDFEEYKGFVYNVSTYDDISRLYVLADMLITDYSSVFFDYANLKRPIIFYMYDKEYYGEDLRGFYLDLDELPGPIIEKQDELIDTIKSVDDWFAFDDRYQAFNDKFNKLDDGKASERFAKRVFGE